MEEVSLFNESLLEKIKAITADGIKSAAFGFSSMVGRKIEIGEPAMSFISPLAFPKIVGGGDDDAVGIYLRFNGDLIGQIMIIISHQKAFELVDILMDTPAGTTLSLGSLEKSALGEVGNLCGSFFLNSIAKSVGVSARPSPPAVMVDIVGAIVDIVVATSAGTSDPVLLAKANFVDGPRNVAMDFWVIPDMHTLQALIKKNSRV